MPAGEEYYVARNSIIVRGGAVVVAGCRKGGYLANQRIDHF